MKKIKKLNVEPEDTVTVFYESDSHAEEVCSFVNEETYMRFLPHLKKDAKEQGMIVTESLNYRDNEPFAYTLIDDNAISTLHLVFKTREKRDLAYENAIDREWEENIEDTKYDDDLSYEEKLEILGEKGCLRLTTEEYY